MQQEHIKKFEELFRQKYFNTMLLGPGLLSAEDNWKEYLEKHKLNTKVKKNNPEMVIVMPWPDIPFAIPKIFFENTLVLGDLP